MSIEKTNNLSLNTNKKKMNANITFLVAMFLLATTSLAQAQDRFFLRAINQADENLQQLLPDSKIKELISSDFVIYNKKNSMLIAMQNGDFHVYGTAITSMILAMAKRGVIIFVPTNVDKESISFDVYNGCGEKITLQWETDAIPCKVTKP